MPIRQLTCYVAACDRCGDECEGMDYVEHCPTKAEAKETAEENDWYFYEGKMWCERCIPPCKCGHQIWRHGRHVEGCEDCPCLEFVPDEEHHS